MKNRIASRTLIERGDRELGAIRLAAAMLRRALKTGQERATSRAELIYLMLGFRNDARAAIKAGIADGKYRAV